MLLLWQTTRNTAQERHPRGPVQAVRQQSIPHSLVPPVCTVQASVPTDDMSPLHRNGESTSLSTPERLRCFPWLIGECERRRRRCGSPSGNPRSKRYQLSTGRAKQHRTTRAPIPCTFPELFVPIFSDRNSSEAPSSQLDILIHDDVLSCLPHFNHETNEQHYHIPRPGMPYTRRLSTCSVLGTICSRPDHCRAPNI